MILVKPTISRWMWQWAGWCYLLIQLVCCTWGVMWSWRRCLELLVTVWWVSEKVLLDCTCLAAGASSPHYNDIICVIIILQCCHMLPDYNDVTLDIIIIMSCHHTTMMAYVIIIIMLSYVATLQWRHIRHHNHNVVISHHTTITTITSYLSS